VRLIHGFCDYRLKDKLRVIAWNRDALALLDVSLKASLTREAGMTLDEWLK